MLDELYAWEGEELEYIVAARRLDPQLTAATKQLALLVAGGRQLAGLEEWTDVNQIRRICDEFGKRDDSNFAATISRMDDVFSFQGKARNRTVRLNRQGIDQLRDLVVKLAGPVAQ